CKRCKKEAYTDEKVGKVSEAEAAEEEMFRASTSAKSEQKTARKSTEKTTGPKVKTAALKMK
ncbi:hypothetical protein HHI36_015217, partial [Cryptolaemus montrouzieri]